MGTSVFQNNVITLTLPDTGREVLLADVLDGFLARNKTGALFVDVKQSSVYPVRIDLRDGDIHCISFGPLKGSECLELLEFYDFENAVFLDMLVFPKTHDIPVSSWIVSYLRSMGKTVRFAGH
jgi:hypothetical protein